MTLDRADNLAPLPAPEKALLAKAAPSEPVRLCLLTATTVDVGLWFRDRPLWLVVTDKSLVLLADGPRPFVDHAAIDELDTSFYSHRCSELVLVPAPMLRVRSIAVPPDDGWTILKLLGVIGRQQVNADKNTSNNNTNSTPAANAAKEPQHA